LMALQKNPDGNTVGELTYLKEVHESVLEKNLSVQKETKDRLAEIAWELKHFPKIYPKKRRKKK
jgi:hypothetical protein